MLSPKTAAAILLGLILSALAAPLVLAGPVKGLAWPNDTPGTVATSTTGAALPPCADGRTVLIQNNDSAIAVRLGPDGVTSSLGFRLLPGSAVEWEISAGSVFVASESGTPTLNVICGFGGSVR